MYLKDLPSNKQIKEFFQNKFDINDKESFLKVINSEKTKEAIYIKVSYKKELCFVPSFYYSIDYFNTSLKEFTLRIDKKYFDHFNKNFILLDEYLKELKKEV